MRQISPDLPAVLPAPHELPDRTMSLPVSEPCPGGYSGPVRPDNSIYVPDNVASADEMHFLKTGEASGRSLGLVD